MTENVTGNPGQMRCEIPEDGCGGRDAGPGRRSGLETAAMDVAVAAPQGADAGELIEAVRASRSLHRPYLDPPDTPARFAVPATPGGAVHIPEGVNGTSGQCLPLVSG